jgi:nucleotide-binding universal stress UspA family protein
MLRSILVALDGSPSSSEAGRFALALAQGLDVHVAGLGIVNSVWIQRPEPVPIGGTALKRAMDLRALQSATERVAAVLQAFGEQAREAHVASLVTREADGNPLDLIELEATAHDLVVIGSNSLFDVDGEAYEVPLCIDRIIRGEPRPVLLVPPSLNGNLQADLNAPVLVAFDGSAAASRAVHMFALLGLGEGREIHVLTLDNRSEKAAALTAARACALLLRHDVAKAHAIGLGDREAGTPAETILGTAKALGVGMIVMGAYGHSGIREIFGSSTRAVLAHCPKPFFLHH